MGWNRNKVGAAALAAVAVAGGGVGAGAVALTHHSHSASPAVGRRHGHAAVERRVGDALRRRACEAVDLRASSKSTRPASAASRRSRAAARARPPRAPGSSTTPSGHIITNEHVIDGASSVRVKFSDGSTAAATVVASDISSDIAVLKVNVATSKLKPLALGDSSALAVGDGVVAIGNPFGLDGSVTTGIVSALDREISAPDNTPIEGAIQTDAAINHGNSGGPLFNLAGQVVGITSQIQSDSGANDGVGFAIPSNTVKTVVAQLMTTGKVAHPLLGVRVGTAANGVSVASVESGSGAAKAGLKAGDVITAVNDTALTSPEQLRTIIAAHKPGDVLTVEVRRSGATKTFQVTLGSRTTEQQSTNSRRRAERHPTLTGGDSRDGGDEGVSLVVLRHGVGGLVAARDGCARSDGLGAPEPGVRDGRRFRGVAHVSDSELASGHGRRAALARRRPGRLAAPDEGGAHRPARPRGARGADGDDRAGHRRGARGPPRRRSGDRPLPGGAGRRGGQRDPRLPVVLGRHQRRRTSASSSTRPSRRSPTDSRRTARCAGSRTCWQKDEQLMASATPAPAPPRMPATAPCRGSAAAASCSSSARSCAACCSPRSTRRSCPRRCRRSSATSRAARTSPGSSPRTCSPPRCPPRCGASSATCTAGRCSSRRRSSSS